MGVSEIAGLVIADPDARPQPALVRVSEGRIAEVKPLTEPFACTLRRKSSDWPDKSDIVIVPGFIDSHCHPLETGLALLFPDLKGCRTIAEVLARLADGMSRVMDTGLLFGFNLEPELLAERRYPTRQELDRVAGKIPSLVYRVDGHSGVVNSAGLSLVSGGSDLSKEELESGLLRGRAYEQASASFKRRLGPDVVLEALILAGRLAAARGITTIGAMVGSPEYEDREWAVLLDGLARMAVTAIPFMQTWEPERAKSFGQPRVGGCLLIDGSFGSRTAALTADYADEKGNLGVLYQSDERLTGFISEANRLGLQTAFHAIGDRAIEQLIRCHKKAKTELGNPLRHRIEHAELLSSELIQEIAALGLVLAVQPEFEAIWGGPEGMYWSRLDKRWRMTNPYRSLTSAQVILAGSSDSPITEFEPLGAIRAAVNHPNEHERVAPSQALALFTTNAAYSLFLEKRTGRVAPGMDADLTILSGDPRTEGECRVIATYRQGRKIYEEQR
ncbi:MAG: amidohydrolase family protein [candidate division WOR-3 bacterium]